MCTQNATSVIVLHHRPNFGSDSGYQGRGQTGLGNPAGGRYEVRWKFAAVIFVDNKWKIQESNI